MRRRARRAPAAGAVVAVAALALATVALSAEWQTTTPGELQPPATVPPADAPPATPTVTVGALAPGSDAPPLPPAMASAAAGIVPAPGSVDTAAGHLLLDANGVRLGAAPTTDGSLCVLVDDEHAGLLAGCGAALSTERPTAAIVARTASGVLVAGLAADGVAIVEALDATGAAVCAATVARNAYACRAAATAGDPSAWRATAADGTVTTFGGAALAAAPPPVPAMPEAVRAAFEVMETPRWMAGYPGRRIRFDQARLLGEVPGERRVLRIWEAPMVNGVRCAVIEGLSQPGAMCGSRGGLGLDFEPKRRGVAWSDRRVTAVGRAASAAVTVAVQRADGTERAVPAFDGWYAAELDGSERGAIGRPIRLVYRDGAGNEVGHAELQIDHLIRTSMSTMRFPEPTASSVRTVARAVIPGPPGEATLRVGRAANGQRCIRLLIDGRPARPGPWRCGITGETFGPRLLRWQRHIGDDAFVAYGWVNRRVTRIVVRFQDGETADVPITSRVFLYVPPRERWVSGHRPEMALAYDAQGRRIFRWVLAHEQSCVYPVPNAPCEPRVGAPRTERAAPLPVPALLTDRDGDHPRLALLDPTTLRPRTPAVPVGRIATPLDTSPAGRHVLLSALVNARIRIAPVRPAPDPGREVTLLPGPGRVVGGAWLGQSSIVVLTERPATRGRPQGSVWCHVVDPGPRSVRTREIASRPRVGEVAEVSDRLLVTRHERGRVVRIDELGSDCRRIRSWDAPGIESIANWTATTRGGRVAALTTDGRLLVLDLATGEQREVPRPDAGPADGVGIGQVAWVDATRLALVGVERLEPRTNGDVAHLGAWLVDTASGAATRLPAQGSRLTVAGGLILVSGHAERVDDPDARAWRPRAPVGLIALRPDGSVAWRRYPGQAVAAFTTSGSRLYVPRKHWPAARGDTLDAATGRTVGAWSADSPLTPQFFPPASR